MRNRVSNPPQSVQTIACLNGWLISIMTQNRKVLVYSVLQQTMKSALRTMYYYLLCISHWLTGTHAEQDNSRQVMYQRVLLLRARMTVNNFMIYLMHFTIQNNRTFSSQHNGLYGLLPLYCKHR